MLTSTKLFAKFLHIITLLASTPYYIVYQRGTSKPIESMIESQSDNDMRTRFKHWCRYKTREASYVQVAVSIFQSLVVNGRLRAPNILTHSNQGAVMFASTVGCLSWPVVTTSHWTCPAFWYISIVFAVCSILTGAQQTLVLASDEAIDQLENSAIEDVKHSFTNQMSAEEKPSAIVLFTWQVPIMLLCYCILTFMVGLGSAVYGPLARNLRWDGNSKVGFALAANSVISDNADDFYQTALVFTIGALSCAFSWVIASLVVMRLRIPGHLMTDSKWGSSWRSK